MNQIKKDIVDNMLESYPGHRSFETEHFIYWVLEETHLYDGYKVTRDEFKHIKQYAAYNGTLPSVNRKNEELKTVKIKNSIEPEYQTHTNSYELILRYSKTYDSLELYTFRIEVKAPFRNNEKKRLIVMKRLNKIFSISNKGYVRVMRTRWLSLKNYYVFFCQNGPVNEALARLLIYSMIGKEWVLDLPLETYNISNKSVRKANSLEEAITIECGSQQPKVLKRFFGEDINSLINLYKLIDANKIHDIITFILKNIKMLKPLMADWGGYMAHKLLFYYFLCKDNRCEMQVLEDYFKMALESGEKINTKISSYSTLKKNHDELSRKILLKLPVGGTKLKINEVFPKIKSIPELDIERINTVKRLNAESAELHHCVHSYKDSINRGACAIYSLIYNGQRYTLEVRLEEEFDLEPKSDKEIIFKLNQLKGKHNSNPPESIKTAIENAFKYNNLKFTLNNIYFIREKKDNRKIVQIGNKILEKTKYGTVNRVYEDLPETDCKETREVDELEFFNDF